MTTAPRWFIPGYDASHAMAAVLLRERIDEVGRILMIGAGFRELRLFYVGLWVFGWIATA
jgi:hypothetical protein